MASEDDDKPRKKITHEIGQDLSLLSVEELTERIALMNSEIERLQAAMAKKRASKGAANRFFKTEGALRPAGVADAVQLSSRCIRGTRPSQLGQWPTWQINPEENRSFTIG